MLVDLDSNRVLWVKEAHLRRAPASLTKLMTAVVASDLTSLDTPVTVTGEAAAAEPSRMGLVAGQTLTVRELLYGALLNSGNDAAFALGDGIVPLDRFLSLMNRKAGYLHLRDTHFSTPNGLTDPDNYTSAYDLAVLSAYVVRNYPDLVAIAATRDHVIPAADTHPAFYPHNLNHFLDVLPGRDGPQDGLHQRRRRLPDRDRETRRPSPAAGPAGLRHHVRRRREADGLRLPPRLDLGGVPRPYSASA